MNKCLTVLVNLLIWDQHAPPEGIVSLCLCLFGGVIYKQAPMRKTGPKDTEHEIIDKESAEPLVKSQNKEGNSSLSARSGAAAVSAEKSEK